MCLLIEGNPLLMDGWGCCRCRTYNGLHRDLCKFCGEPHHPLGTVETPDIIEAREEES